MPAGQFIRLFRVQVNTSFLVSELHTELQFAWVYVQKVHSMCTKSTYTMYKKYTEIIHIYYSIIQL